MILQMPLQSQEMMIIQLIPQSLVVMILHMPHQSLEMMIIQLWPQSLVVMILLMPHQSMEIVLILKMINVLTNVATMVKKDGVMITVWTVDMVQILQVVM